MRTFFNMLGPLVNPTLPKNQLLGVYNLKLMRLYRYIAQNENINCTIVHSLDGYDEISLTSPFKVVTNNTEHVMQASDLGLSGATQADLFGGDTVEEAAKVFDTVLEGSASEAKKNCVIANAALAIKTLEPNLTLEHAVSEATESLRSGAALERFKIFVELNS